jgi:hypothetical protein
MQEVLDFTQESLDYIVAYAKITEDDTGITLQGVYFGGVGKTFDEAEVIARECVNTIRGGTIIPKVLKLTRPQQLTDVFYDVMDAFESITAQMIEADETIKRAQTKRK